MSSLVPVESKVICAWFVEGKLAPLSEENVEKRRYWVLTPTGISRDQMTQMFPARSWARLGVTSLFEEDTICVRLDQVPFALLAAYSCH